VSPDNPQGIGLPYGHDDDNSTDIKAFAVSDFY
jgi:hypothetical protein